MKVTPKKTGIITAYSTDITEIIKNAVPVISENSLLAVTSKVVSLCEGNVADPQKISKYDLIEKEADLFLPHSGNKYDVYMTIKNGKIIANAGVDESNTGGFYVLWPKDPQASAVRIWNFLKEHYGLNNVGVIITDSATSPLKWGVTGISVAHCGFKAVESKVGESDLFGRKLRMTRVNVLNALAAAAVLVMGESNEQTPLALIEDVPFVHFLPSPPSEEELKSEIIDMKDDLYGEILTAVKWQKGKK